MSELLRRLVWFFLVASTIAYSVFLVVGSSITASAIDATRIVQVRDALSLGEHHLSGIVMVQTTCTELSVKTEKISEAVYQLTFTTWQEPSVECVAEDTPRAFRAVLFAPSTGIRIVGTLDAVPLTLVVTPVIPVH